MILVLNCGSQSIKYKLFSDDLKLLAERQTAVKSQRVYPQKLNQELKKLKRYQNQIKMVGHRVVHGGQEFRKPVGITPQIVRAIAKYNGLAPLHNPFNVLGMKAALQFFPKAKQTAVFDTAFYRNLPQYAAVYPLPQKIRAKYGFQRFGFHGISHQYAVETAAQKMGRPLKKLKIISCHLGGGSSVTAVKNGQAVDTSMGYTPLEGVTMMTRSGDLDPGIVLLLAKTFSPRKADEILNTQAGLKGICGMNYMTEILKKAERGNRAAKLALKIFVYRIQKYIGGYQAVLGGCDALVFTGAIGWGSRAIRQMIGRPFKVKIVAVEPNEELAIARELKK